MARKSSTPEVRPDLYARITDTIVQALQQGVRPWVQPWTSHPAGAVSRPLRHNLQPYSGINVLVLWSRACERGFSAPIWMTFNQALELGAHVGKGETGAMVVYANRLHRTEVDDSGEESLREIPFLKAYTVFNVEQIEGLPSELRAAPASPVDPAARVETAEAFFAGLAADVRHGGGSAYYAPGPDYVQMPAFETFRSAEGYYATLAHEMTHWTRHPSRLNRDLGRERFGDEGYAREELVVRRVGANVGVDCMNSG